ncbi:54S ribosomal protein img2, mitochondrial [Emydomyces testavorans]|uniref:Large ribosomal subunit protein mL49 n=1 Tax=Emydomyces testavorans TaxID=2070801 RepID=A0AAF0DCS8_9EURO|nr:54S ribosomal protein img2, mitochondrial [Emydomyces testavorans]
MPMFQDIIVTIRRPIVLNPIHTSPIIASPPLPPFQPITSKSTIKSPPTSANLSAGETTPRPALPLTNLPYFIRRTPSNQLPVYLVTKAGGTRQETKLQKTEGDVDALREDLIKVLGMEQNPSDVTINRLNGHVTVKGWRKPEIQQFLLDRKF